jgi:hypothetical protein
VCRGLILRIAARKITASQIQSFATTDDDEEIVYTNDG